MARPRRATVIAVVGPTASGKSDLAVSIAKRFRGEIVSADSRQIYRGLDIGTGKVPGRWHAVNVADKKRPRANVNIFVYRGIRHHCVDFVSPRRAYTAAEFQRHAGRAIRAIARRGKPAIVVGGSGFWVDALLKGERFPAVPPNATLRKSLAGEKPDTLLRRLHDLDPDRARTIERGNPRRIIRAIEIARAIGCVPERSISSPWRVLWIGIQLPQRELERKIRTRLARHMRMGMVAEARRMQRRGLPWKRFSELGLEYRLLAEYLRGKIDQRTLLTRLQRAIRRYARRQYAWFRRNPAIRWVRNPTAAEGIVRAFLRETSAPKEINERREPPRRKPTPGPGRPERRV